MRRSVVAVTRDETHDASLSERLRELGAEVLALPTIAIDPAEDPEPLDRALARLGDFDWLVFTSPNAVDALASRPGWPRLSSATLRVTAVGAQTARRLAESGVPAGLTGLPEDAGAAATAAAIIAAGGGSLRGRRVLWPRSSIGRPALQEMLLAAGAEVTAPVAYRVRPLADNARTLAHELASGRVDAVTFLSPSSARSLASARTPADLGWLLESGVTVASLGPTTSEALRRLGAPPALEPAERSAAALAEALVNHLHRKAAS
jgi:uroporphyrinogen-III synthase